VSDFDKTMTELNKNVESISFEEISSILDVIVKSLDQKIELKIRFSIMKKISNKEIERLYRKSNGLECFHEYIPSALCTYLSSNGNISEYMRSEFKKYIISLSLRKINKIDKFNLQIIEQNLNIK
jgi:hypothetical protein